MFYLYYRDEREGGFAREAETRALSRLVDVDVHQLALAAEAQYADPGGGFNVRHCDGAETAWGEIVIACSVLPFLSASQVVRVSGLIGASSQRRAKSGDDPSRPGVSPDGLADLVRGLPETTVLILEEGTLKSSSAHLKALERLDVPKTVQGCPPLQGDARARWIADEVRRRGGAIEREAARALAEALPGVLWSVSCAIDTLMAYAGPGGRITTEAVGTLVVSDQSVSSFQLADAIAGRNAPLALRLLHDLTARGMVEEQIMALLVNRVRDWAMVAAFRGDRVPEQEAIKQLGWNPGKYQTTARGTGNFARGELPAAYQALVIADEALKSRPGDERPLIMDMLVLTLANRGDPEALRRLFPVPAVL